MTAASAPPLVQQLDEKRGETSASASASSSHDLGPDWRLPKKTDVLGYDDLDRNHDGDITRQEFALVLPKGVHPAAEDLAATTPLFGPEGAASGQEWCGRFFDDYWEVLRSQSAVIEAVEAFAPSLETFVDEAEASASKGEFFGLHTCAQETEAGKGCVNERRLGGACFTSNAPDAEPVECLLVADAVKVKSHFLADCAGRVEKLHESFLVAAARLNEHGENRLRAAAQGKFQEVCQTTHRMETWTCESHATPLNIVGDAKDWCDAYWKDYYAALVPVVRAEDAVLKAVVDFAPPLEEFLIDGELAARTAKLGLLPCRAAEPGTPCFDASLPDFQGPCFSNSTQAVTEESTREPVPCILQVDEKKAKDYFFPKCYVHAKSTRTLFDIADSLLNAKGQKRLKDLVEKKFQQVCAFAPHRLDQWECAAHAAMPGILGADATGWCNTFFHDHYTTLLPVVKAEHACLNAVDIFASPMGNLVGGDFAAERSGFFGLPPCGEGDPVPGKGCVNSTSPQGPCFKVETSKDFCGRPFKKPLPNQTWLEPVDCLLVADEAEVRKHFLPNCAGDLEAAQGTCNKATPLLNLLGKEKLQKDVEEKFLEVCRGTTRETTWQCEAHSASFASRPPFGGPAGGAAPKEWCDGFWQDYYQILVDEAQAAKKPLKAVAALGRPLKELTFELTFAGSALHIPFCNETAEGEGCFDVPSRTCFKNNTGNEPLSCVSVAEEGTVRTVVLPNCTLRVETVQENFKKAEELVKTEPLRKTVEEKFTDLFCSSNKTLAAEFCEGHAPTLPAGSTAEGWCDAFWKDYYQVLLAETKKNTGEAAKETSGFF